MYYAGYRTALGSCVCADTLEYLKTLPDGSINLVVTSPPFALQRKKEYGNESQSAYVDWLCQFGALVFDNACILCIVCLFTRYAFNHGYTQPFCERHQRGYETSEPVAVVIDETPGGVL